MRGSHVLHEQPDTRVQRGLRALDGPWSCALAAADLGSLECRPGRARAGEQAGAIAEYYFCIGSHIDEQRQLVAEIGTLGEYHARGIRPDMPRNARQHVDARVW